MDGKSSKMIVLSLLGWLVLSFPLLSIVSVFESVLGIPVLFLYVFTAWLLFIGVIFLISQSRKS